MLLASALLFISSKNSNLKIILRFHNTKELQVLIPRTLGKQQRMYQEQWGLPSYTGVQRISRENGICTKSIPASMYSPN